MASIHHEFPVAVPAAFAWEAIRDFGAVHSRLARGFVTSVELDGNERKVVFANGFTVCERLVGIDDLRRRLAYSAVGGRASHHNAYFQVIPEGDTACRLVWVTDLLPDEMQAPVGQMVEQGAQAIRQTLESRYRDGQ